MTLVPPPKNITLRVITPRPNFITMGMNYFTKFQNEIVQECVEKTSGGLSLPMGTGKTLISILVGLIQSNNYVGSKILVIVSKSLITT